MTCNRNELGVQNICHLPHLIYDAPVQGLLPMPGRPCYSPNRLQIPSIFAFTSGDISISLG